MLKLRYNWHMEEPAKILGTDGKWKPSRRLSSDERAARDDGIRRRRAEGASIPTLATEFECSVGTVHGVIKKMREN